MQISQAGEARLTAGEEPKMPHEGRWCPACGNIEYNSGCHEHEYQLDRINWLANDSNRSGTIVPCPTTN